MFRKENLSRTTFQRVIQVMSIIKITRLWLGLSKRLWPHVSLTGHTGTTGVLGHRITFYKVHSYLYSSGVQHT